MKFLLLTLTILAFPKFSKGQAIKKKHAPSGEQGCRIVVYNNNPTEHLKINNRMMPFKIILKDTSFQALSGELFLSHKALNKFGNSEVVEFKFYNDLDLEYYRTPMIFRKNITLISLCGKLLIAEDRYIGNHEE